MWTARLWLDCAFPDLCHWHITRLFCVTNQLSRDLQQLSLMHDLHMPFHACFTACITWADHAGCRNWTIWPETYKRTNCHIYVMDPFLCWPISDLFDSQWILLTVSLSDTVRCCWRKEVVPPHYYNRVTWSGRDHPDGGSQFLLWDCWIFHTCRLSSAGSDAAVLCQYPCLL